MSSMDYSVSSAWMKKPKKLLNFSFCSLYNLLKKGASQKAGGLFTNKKDMRARGQKRQHGYL